MSTRVKLMIVESWMYSKDYNFLQGRGESLIAFADRVDSVLRARLGLLDDEAHSFVQRELSAAREEGRAAGYAEAIEQAAKFMRVREEAHIVNIKKWGQAGDERAESASIQLASECAIAGDAIRALAPAKEEP